jgi:hypothetical protein
VTAPAIVQGAKELAARLGGWPSFHDAEVVDLLLHRSGESMLVLQLPDPEHSIVEFVLTGISDLEFVEFNEQNVIGSLTIENGDDGALIRLWPCYGINGWIKAQTILVRSR